MPYGVERGVRVQVPPPRIFDVLTGRRCYQILLARQPLIWHNQDDYRALEMMVAEGTQMSRSGVAVPIFAGDRLLSFVSVENMERENAFGDADVRLLSTVASSMGVALENARLFDETQRLLKETERRSSELAVINSIQQGMAAELNFQAIVDLVGDKLREMFATGDLAIHWRDETTDLVHHLYVYEHGQRLAQRRTPYKPEAKINQALQTGRPVVLGDRAAMNAIGIKTVRGNGRQPVVHLRTRDGRRAPDRRDLDRELRARACFRRSAGASTVDHRSIDGRRTGKRATARGNAAPRARVRGAGRSRARPVVVARPRHRHGPHRRPREGPAAGRQQRDLRAGSGTTTYRAIVAVGDIADAIKAMVIEGGVGIIGSIVQSGEPELVNDAEADPRGVQIPGTARQQDERLMVVPLVADDAVEGAMAVWRTGGQPFDDRDLQFLAGPGAAGDGRAAQCAAVQRNQGRARAADGHGRCPQGHQRFANRRATRVRGDREARHGTLGRFRGDRCPL